MTRIRRTLAALVALAGWACGSSTQPDATPQVASVVVTPSSSTLALNAQLPLQAEVRDGTGALVPNASVVWTVQDAAVATVSAAGVVTAKAIGSTQVAANALGKSGIATITVTKTPVASVVVLPDQVDVNVGSTAQLTASAFDASQNALTDRAFTWTTSNANVATVNASGVVTGVGSGSATITASADGVQGTAAVNVTLIPVAAVIVSPSALDLTVGQTGQLSAELRDAANNVLTGRVVSWKSSDPKIAAVDANTGKVTAIKRGSVTVTAESGGVKGSATVDVGPAPVKSVSVSPGSKTLTAGTSTQLSVTVTDVNGGTVSSPSVTWNTSDAQIAGVTSTGTVTTAKTGTATITATSDGVSGTADITVTPGAVASVSVVPKVATLQKGQTVQLAATALDKFGNTITTATFTWSSSSSRVATVSSTGVVTGKRSGLATIKAATGGKSDSAAITVLD